MTVQAVVLASGYGKIKPNFPKVCEKIEELPMISRAVRTVCNLTDRVIVTVNPLFEKAIKEALSSYAVRYVVQSGRNGSADAVQAALSLEGTDSDFTLVVFGDMPFWSLTTLRELVEACQQERPTLGLAFLKIDAGTPEVIKRYGRILRNEEGKIIAIIEPRDLSDDFVLKVSSVNPSLYCFDTAWLRKNLGKVPLRDKGDGYPHEKSLPHLVVIAAEQNRYVIEIPFEGHFFEALGINTLEELEYARQIASSL